MDRVAVKQHARNAYDQARPYLHFAMRLAIRNPVWTAAVCLYAFNYISTKLEKWFLSSNTVLELNLRNTLLQEETGKDFFGFSINPGSHLHSMVQTLHTAASDSRVKGLVVNLGNMGGTLAQRQELRDAIIHFRNSGKRTVCYVDTFGEAGQATIQYWFATACEEIYMPTIGNLTLLGLKVAVPFLRQLLSKMEIEPEFEARRKYKNAANMFMEDSFTPEHKEATQHLVDGVYNQIVQDIASSRSMNLEDARAIIENGPYDSTAALQLKLISGVSYEHDFYYTFLPEAFQFQGNIFGYLWNQMWKFTQNPKGLNLIYLQKYAAIVGKRHTAYRKKNSIAVIHVNGTIHVGKSAIKWDGTTTSAGSDSIVRSIRNAIDDPKVKAIILRIASPGGSAVASDLIAAETRAAKAAGKKVIVSMSQYAASGGYYIACYADKIVACPTTLTGSIGVIAGKMNLRGAWGKVGITFDTIQTSENADFMDFLTKLSPANKQRMEKWIDNIYETFKTHVSNGRGLSMERVEEIAQGRVWIGATAKEIGLVDVLGGFEQAVEVAKQELGLKPTDKVNLVSVDKPLTFLKLLIKPRNSRDKNANPFIEATQSIGTVVQDLASVLHTAAVATKQPEVAAMINAIDQSNLEMSPIRLSLEDSVALIASTSKY